MDANAWLAEQFEGSRGHLRAVAYRMLGSLSEADDAVQETWLRLSRSDTAAIENLGGWLTTVVARVCLDMLRSRKSRREEALEHVPEPIASPAEGGDPEQEALLAAARGGDFAALLAVLDPDVVLRADVAAVQMGAAGEVRGARAVAETFGGRSKGARRAFILGVPALVWAPGGKPRVVFSFTM